MLGELDAPGLGNAEVRAFADDLCPNFIAVGPKCIVGGIAHVGVILVRRLDVRADTAEPQQIDGTLENGVDERGGIERRRLDAERVARFSAQRDRLFGPREDAATLGNQLAVVIVPA